MHLCSVSCEMLLIKLFIDGRTLIYGCLAICILHMIGNILRSVNACQMIYVAMYFYDCKVALQLYIEIIFTMKCFVLDLTHLANTSDNNI